MHYNRHFVKKNLKKMLFLNKLSKFIQRKSLFLEFVVEMLDFKIGCLRKAQMAPLKYYIRFMWVNWKYAHFCIVWYLVELVIVKTGIWLLLSTVYFSCRWDWCSLILAWHKSEFTRIITGLSWIRPLDGVAIL